MIRISALIFLFTIQFLLIFWGLAVFLFLRNKKLIIKSTISQGEIRRLENEIKQYKEEITGLSGWQEMFNNLQGKFEKVNSVNSKLKAMIDVLVPEAERSREFQEIINEVEQNNNELGTCIGALQKENEALNQQMKTFEKDVSGLSRKLKDSVKKEEYQSVLNEKQSLERKQERLREELENKTKEYEKLEKNYIYLEKEYNALYNNFKGEQS
jgi:chromosome segregation ATPase